MSQFTEQQDVIQDLRKRRNEAEAAFRLVKNRILVRQAKLDKLIRSGEKHSCDIDRLRAEIKQLQSQVVRNANVLAGFEQSLFEAKNALTIFQRPQKAIEELGDSIPILLLPLRIETKFMAADNGTELWVRIFPDDIAIDSHEKLLTADERDTGFVYWREVWKARQNEEEAEMRSQTKGAWRALAGEYGAPRAAWILEATQPTSLAVENLEALDFPDLHDDALSPESWNRAPRSDVMPDRFVVTLYSDGRKSSKIGEPLPEPLITGLDPLSEDDELIQSNADMLPGRNLDWIYDFDRAVEMGMAVKMPLTPNQAAQGIDQLTVIGLRLSSNELSTKSLIEELLTSHRFAPDGMAIIPQGAPTNNTEDERSGFNRIDPGADRSFEVETGDAMFEMAADRASKSDAQRLVEALGIDKAPLQFLANADRFDFRDAIRINKALWPATAGYFLEELLGISAETVRRVRRFFTDYVTGRGPLPALRVGNQPYGLLPTTAFDRWQASADFDDPRDPPLLDELVGIFAKLDQEWEKLTAKASHINRAGDGLENLLDVLGLHASSIEFHRRHSVGRDFRWNYLHFAFANNFVTETDNFFKTKAEQLIQRLGFQFNENAKIFDLSFFEGHDKINDPFVDDVPSAEEERWLENHFLKNTYKIAGTGKVANYIGWLVESSINEIKRQKFVNGDDETQPVPRALLYRMLRRALLLTYHDATMQLYERQGIVRKSARREMELTNIEEERTVTRWEFMEARMRDVMPQVSNENISVVDFLQSPGGFDLPEAVQISDIQESLGELAKSSTAALERLFAEHLDLCSYRLDAWQMSLITQRLERLREPIDSASERKTGLYLGAFGYLEDIRPGPPKTPAVTGDIPESLRGSADAKIFEQPDNGGFIAAPSLAHAVTAAVLRNAYLSHADSENPERMAVNLSSERVRTALTLIEGIRNGQELGALLGYQFERGLHDRHGDPSLNQFILAFRNRYPLLADKITQNEDGAQIETKEARNVFDGYTLVEKAFLIDDPIPYPYDVAGLPPDNSNDPQVIAIKTEVERMRESFDALADLALSEGVFQVAQGNFERAGAMMRALTQGANPPDPEIARTPRGGVTLTQKAVINLPADGDAGAWADTATPRALIEPSVNLWLADMLGGAEHLRFTIASEQLNTTDETMTAADLKIQPIDLIYLVGDGLINEASSVSQNEVSELELRIADAYRRKQAAAGVSDAGRLTISFTDRGFSWEIEDKTLFEVLPLLRSLREILTGCRALAADDFELPSEASAKQDVGGKGFDETEARLRITSVVDQLGNHLAVMRDTIAFAEAASAGNAELEALVHDLRTLAGYGLPDAFPAGRESLLEQAKAAHASADVKQKAAQAKIDSAGITPGGGQSLTDEEKVEIYVEAAKILFDESFSFLPRFSCTNPDELSAAVMFRDADQTHNLTRFSQNPLIVDEWFQGVGRVREKMSVLEDLLTLNDAFNANEYVMKPLQIPFRPNDHWLAVEFPGVEPGDPDDPEAFRPEGDYVSVVQLMASDEFDPLAEQKGLVIDEWQEVIPNRRETAGIAVHYDQPSTEPPQAALLAVSPAMTGSWDWNDLEATILETFARAKKRAVEPDHIGDTPFGHILPAILTAVTSNRFATISTDLIYESELALDGAAGNN